MKNLPDGQTSNRIENGIFFHAIVQGRDITLQLPETVQPALFGLPALSSAFTGRNEKLQEILRLISPISDVISGVSIHLISGLGGIGKTELALQVAQKALEGGTFPGGVLFVDVFGYDEQRLLSPQRALTGFLQSLGVPEDRIPEDVQTKSRLYRSILAAYADAGRQILVVIDNASSAEQVIDLLPADRASAALVTSRHTLSIGARIHELSVLDADASVQMLQNLLNISLGEEEERIEAERESALSLSSLCGYLPLALQICAALLADTPRRPISSLVESMRSAHSILDQLHREDRAVRAVFDLSYARLTEQEKRLLGFLSFSPGPDASTAAAARLINDSETAAEQMLVNLSRAHLVEQGVNWGRWRLHDLLRLYALEEVATIPGQEEALTRLLEYYLDLTRHAASAVMNGEANEVFTAREKALQWLDGERQNLTATVYLAAGNEGISGYAVDISFGLAKYFDVRRLFNDWKGVMEISLDIVRQVDYKEFEASVLDSLGMACRQLYQLSASVDFHTEAVRLARTVGDQEMLARLMNNMGNALVEAHEYSTALDIHSEAAELFEGLGEVLGFARSIDGVANSLRELGRGVEALEKHNLAIEKFREAGAAESEARSLSHMASTLLELGRVAESVDANTNAARLLLSLSLAAEGAHTLNNLANALRLNDDLEEAFNVINEALELHEANHDLVGKARAHNQRGLINSDRGALDQAVIDFRTCLEILSNFDGLIEEGYAFANLGRVHGMAGRLGEAVEDLKMASGIFVRHGAEDDNAKVQQLIGLLSMLIRSNGEPEAAL